LRFALVWIPAPAEILSGRLDPAERHLRTVSEGEFQPRRLNGGHGTARSTAKTMGMTVVPLYLFDRKITDANGTDPSLPEQRLHCLCSFFDRYKWIGPMNLIDIE